MGFMEAIRFLETTFRLEKLPEFYSYREEQEERGPSFQEEMQRILSGDPAPATPALDWDTLHHQIVRYFDLNRGAYQIGEVISAWRVFDILRAKVEDGEITDVAAWAKIKELRTRLDQIRRKSA